jgi:phage/plasmid-associated DNA primase
MKTKYSNKQINDMMKLDDGSVCEHDVLYKGCWSWCRTDTMVYNVNNNMEYNKWDNLTPQKSPNKKETKREKVIEKEKKEIKVSKEDIEMAELMDVSKYLTDYDAWSKTIWAMRNAGFTYEFCMKLNQKATKINQIKDIWDSTTNKEQLGLGTIYYQAKKSNEKKYYDIKLQNIDVPIYESNEYNIAEVLLSVFGENLVFYNDFMMVYTKDKWRQDPKLDLLRVMISQEGNKYYSNILSMLYKQRSFLDETDPTYDIVKKQINTISDISQLILKTSWKNNISKEIQALVVNRHEEIEFNDNGNVIAFKNKKYNFITKAFEPILKEEYISFSTGYEWEEPTKEKVDKIDKFFCEIFPNEEIRKSYLSIMRTSLLGYTKNHFIVANGSGGNGKGLLNELLMFMLGDDYSYNGNLSVLVDKIKGGANPELANIHKKRLVLFKEPNQKDKIQLGNLKQLVDNESINARGLYQSNTKTELLATFILECNKKLNFSGEVDESEYRRFIDILFESTFTKNEDLLNDTNLKNVYRANQDYKQVNFKKEYCCALFKYIIDNALKDVYIPECVKERTKAYIDSNDSLLSWATQKIYL